MCDVRELVGVNKVTDFPEISRKFEGRRLELVSRNLTLVQQKAGCRPMCNQGSQAARLITRVRSWSHMSAQKPWGTHRDGIWLIAETCARRIGRSRASCARSSPDFWRPARPSSRFCRPARLRHILPRWRDENEPKGAHPGMRRIWLTSEACKCASSTSFA